MHLPQVGPILVIEDNYNDFDIIRLAIEKEGLGDLIYRIVFGPDALDYLHRVMGHQKHIGEPLPQLIITDLRLPGIDGRILIEHIRSEEEFKHIPIIVISELDHQSTINQCFGSGALGFLGKVGDTDELVEDIRIAIRYWTKITSLPDPVKLI